MRQWGGRLSALFNGWRATHESFLFNYLSLTIRAATATQIHHQFPQFPASPGMPSPIGLKSCVSLQLVLLTGCLHSAHTCTLHTQFVCRVVHSWGCRLSSMGSIGCTKTGGESMFWPCFESSLHVAIAYALHVATISFLHHTAYSTHINSNHSCQLNLFWI